MKKVSVLGFVVEFNPFHHGHDYFIKEAIKKVKPDVTIAITSTSFTMRGELSICDKFTKTNIMLRHEIDLILELPFVQAVQSADYFAYNAVNNLIQIGITDLAFGIEDDDLSNIEKLIAILKENEFKSILKEELKKFSSYKKAYTNALLRFQVDEELIALFNEPNITLAIQYIQTIQKLKPEINLHPIKRIGHSFHDQQLSSQYVSAQAIRQALKDNLDITSYLPLQKNEYNLINQLQAEERMFLILNHQMLLMDDSLSHIFGCTEGIENYLRKHLRGAKDYDDLLNNTKNKRYTVSRIRRLILYLLLALPKDLKHRQSYLRILGFSKKGEEYLAMLPAKIKEQIITSFKNINHELCLYELKATKLYGNLTNQQKISQMEFVIPLKKEEDYGRKNS